MTHVTFLQKLVVASVVALLIGVTVLVASLEKPSCNSAASQNDPRSSICNSVYGN